MKLLKILFVLMVISLFVMSGCKKDQPAQETPVQTVPTAPASQAPAQETPSLPASAVPEAPVQTIETTEGKMLEMITQARCLENRIEVVLTNPTDATLTLAKDAKVIMNGLTVVDPECDKLVIAPGESVYCADISGHYSIRNGEMNKIQVNMKAERGLSEVDCTGQQG